MEKSNVLITGANSGMGKVLALELAKRNYHVIMVCRDEKRGRQAHQEIIEKSGDDTIDLMICDLASQASIKGFCQAFSSKYEHLNILINNAGVVLPGRHQTEDGFELQFGVNHLGHFLLTGLLLPLLKKGAPSRIINVSSGAHKMGKLDFDDLQMTKAYKSINAYAQSKLAIVMFTKTLGERLKADGITVNCLHPGITGTQMGVDRQTGSGKLMAAAVKWIALSPEKGARTTLYLATSPEVAAITGEYFYKCQVAKASKLAGDKQLAERLWDVSVQLTGVDPR